MKMNFETYEKCRTIEAIDRVLDFMETDEFQYMIQTAKETGSGWWGDEYECKFTLNNIKTLLKDEIE
jgi:hypothetical protein